MSNAATNAAFRVYAARLSGEVINRIVCIHDHEDADDAMAFRRMVQAFRSPPVVEMVVGRDVDGVNLMSGARAVSFVRSVETTLADDCMRISIEQLASDDPMFGFYQEAQAHDFELGGLIEWNEAVPAQFSRYVLQSMSSIHVRRSFPFDLWNDIASYRQGKRLRCLDVGCGPISKLRYGALNDWLHIVGVDPLNDMYSAILARHGLSAIEKIRPDEVINGFAEEIDFSNDPFDLIYSLNALDHTQDLVKAVNHIGTSMNLDGLAYIKVYTKEGERQNYEGLHKFNIWLQDGHILYNTKDTKPSNLISDVDDLRIEKIYDEHDNACAFTLKKINGSEA